MRQTFNSKPSPVVAIVFWNAAMSLVIVFEHEDGFPQKSFVWVSPLRRKVIDRCGNASGDELLLDDFPDYFPLAAGKATADARHVDGCA